jgi:hypothetical protein
MLAAVNQAEGRVNNTADTTASLKSVSKELDIMIDALEFLSRAKLFTESVRPSSLLPTAMLIASRACD